MIVIFNTKYKGIPAVGIQNEKIRAIFLPEQGAKLCSLVWLETGYEYLYQGKSKKYVKAVYGQDYLQGECAGIDEMFPCVDSFYYNKDPWRGIYFPDHGEVWALPWDCSIQGGKIIFSVYGIRMPYRLIKEVTLADDENGKASVHMEYQVENLSPFPMEYIWAAHMMFRAEEQSRFEFDKALGKAYVTMSDSGTIGKYGDTFHYPGVLTKYGKEYDIRIHRKDVDDYQKFYFADRLKANQGWGRIMYPNTRNVAIRFPAEEIPYLGVVQGEGGKLGLDCMFLEPCTGAFDRPDIAGLHQMGSCLGGGEIKKWYLDIDLEEV